MMLLSIVNRLRHASTFWLIRVLWVMETLACFALLILDILMDDLALSYALILIFGLGVILVTYLVVTIAGEWHSMPRRMHLDVLNTIILILFSLSGCVACYLVLFLHWRGILPYFGVIIIGSTLLSATIITSLFQRPPILPIPTKRRERSHHHQIQQKVIHHPYSRRPILRGGMGIERTS